MVVAIYDAGLTSEYKKTTKHDLQDAILGGLSIGQ